MKTLKVLCVSFLMMFVAGCGTNQQARIDSFKAAQTAIKDVEVEKQKTKQEEAKSVKDKYAAAAKCGEGKDTATVAVCFMGFALLDRPTAVAQVQEQPVQIPVLPEQKSAVRETAEVVGSVFAAGAPILNTFVAGYFADKASERSAKVQIAVSEIDFKKTSATVQGFVDLGTAAVAAAGQDRAPSYVYTVAGDFLAGGSYKQLFNASGGSVAGPGTLIDCKSQTAAGVGTGTQLPGAGGAVNNNCGK